MRRTSRVVMAIAALAVAVLTACGDDDDDSSAPTAGAAETTEDDYLAAIEGALTSGPEAGQMATTSEEAECVAPEWLDTIGVDRLEEQGITPAQIGDDIDDDGSALSDLGLTEDEGNALYDAFGECGVDIEQQFLDAVADELDEEAAACVADAVDGDLLRRLHVSVLLHGEVAEAELQSEIAAAVAPCEELQQDVTTTSG